MIPPKVLIRNSLYSLLYEIDLDLAEQTRVKRCPFAGVRCTAPTTHENLGVDLLILPRPLKFVLVCAVAVKVADAVCCHHLCVFGSVGSTGHLCCCWSAPFAKGKSLLLPWSGSRRFAGYGVQPSSDGNTTFGTFLPKASNTGAWPAS